jgi:hypothetical protein
MSDERFDQDLRSVLLDDAPRDVPEDLRRRVAAVSATPPAGTTVSRRVWLWPVAQWIGALAAVVVVLAIWLWRFGPGAVPGVGDGPSPSALAAPSPSAGETACSATDLAGRILSWQGAAGSRIADVRVANTSAHSCLVRGTPGLQLVDARGRILIDSASAGPAGQPHVASTDPTFELAPGAQIRTEVQASNYCGPAASPPIDIAFALPSGGGRFVSPPGPGVSSADAIPPCLGSTGSHIAMNGWRR